jgi:general secretion pathway protein C
VSVDGKQRRVTVAIVLVTIGLVALFLASGLTRLLAAKFLPLDAAPSAGSATAPAARPLGAGQAAGGRRKDPTAVLRRNIFDSQTGPQDGERVRPPTPEEIAAAEAAAPPEPPPVDPNAPPPPCDATVRLVGAFYTPDRPERSFAAITNLAGKVLLYRVGMPVDGRTVDAIGPNTVYMLQGGSRCSLAMFAPPGGVPAPPPAAPAVAAAAPAEPAGPPESSGGIPAAELDAGITRVSDTEFRIQRGLVNRILENQSELMRTARVVPHEEGGRVVGVKMYGIRRNSLLGRLGMQNGDVLRTINGFDMTSPDKALEAYARLREADHLTLSVIRRGQPTNVNFNIQ